MKTTFDSHNSDCFREWVIAINLSTGRIGTVPSFRKRWDCPGCLPRKITDTLGHLLLTRTDLVTGWESQVVGRRTRREASRLEVGYAAVSFGTGRDRFLITHHPLLDDMPVRDGVEIALELIDLGMSDTIARVSTSATWRADDEEAKHLTICSGSPSLDYVEKILNDAGFERRVVVDMNLEKANNTIRAHLRGVDAGWDVAYKPGD